ncbi:MAG: glycosyltransferase family 4 protein [Rhodocyclaceae bacterium]|nr:glycosyltransferase family 4 protein [Rhodocyclaceae bacterium]
MKIGLIATDIWRSLHLDLARELVRQGHDIEVYTEDNRAPSGMSFTKLDEDGLHFWIIHGFRRNPLTWLLDRLFKFWLGRRFFTTLVAIWRFIRANRDRDVFVVEADWLGFFVAIVGLFEDFRWVVGIHDTDYLDAPIHFPGRPVSRWRSAVQRWVLKRADAVRSNSWVTTDALIAGGCEAAKIATIPLHYLPGRMLPPADIPLPELRAASRAKVLPELGIPADSELLITMCRVTWVKRLELAVEALAAALPQRPNLWLAICGGDRKLPGLGSYAGHLRATAERLGVAHRLLLPGDIPTLRVKEYLAAADLHLAPSWVDTFNYGVVEAALVGTPSLMSTGVGAAPWIVACGAGRVVESADASAWAAAIQAVLAAPATADERRAAQQKLMHELSPAAIAPQVVRCWAGQT